MIELTDDFQQRAQDIRCVIFDVDGVLTDGKLFFDLKGNEYKSFHAQDGQGLKLLQQNGIDVAVISGRSSPLVEQRMKNLGVTNIYQGQENKTAAFNHLLKKLNITPNQVAHVGDDLPDLALMTRTRLAIAVKDANPSILGYCQGQTERLGGHGAAREVCDTILSIQDKLTPSVQLFCDT
ncbi:MAG: 3-deoxy-D-manno-octulosonate 8-phosphate phosphatase (KDO 8-P phosphatase) [Cycloclasticus pugetii]|jgi:3-deoxy-D-manno-octulosonate 8-phosphate phosphatase (KDO 8-P phosphatase)|uniref:3-deoxy-D-manno-octulosonate 8-phosphate phosphatase KdsC n=3 Tax=Cycloclasticus TaxID=34067 RepID=S5T6K9_9GAMM|nr:MULTISPECIES: HAD-IIIA family hydrolase [Cycloclasticus]AFT67676.1 Phosphatase kdsC [Cycloclasticus sp. P1]AGS39154.1 3-deoxy-D-manno-octulosonate 8-phosphate phosphatase (KDO 8-P phosphatase) [Cycloclasticus zancles 78-ME]ATI02780.1 HAD-IIIA family hydrolase [Cycloclasticus sp. PY97N]EPD13524.1 phosphatase kdsC [Cycloclasticus pugetii]MDF1828763.1 HAD-IIIA family hydrolase [Cycloclasticus pugetii]|tara:strand:+ start:1151 stop:1690 length:540 start_codon:yes stop_codon:yes gene_type:complete